ncbi:hypothetical protein ANCCAN_03395 [Ancylostoma caninum]|uniref:Nuclear pore protein n=1 Tax=Ancylostoma caninum TaxID=29170 RepID=A0A368H1Q1_ANCCA|nr:hypothetical protein ANCCAN_03395 [Ancylostoma caninum]
MSSMFDDILSRAEKLSSANFHATLADSAVAKKNASGLFEGNTVQENRYSGTTFDNDLNSVFRASEHLWKKSSATAPIQKSFLFGEKGVVFGVTAPALKETQVLPKPSDDLEPDMDLERVRLESDRSFFNHVLLSRPQPSMTLPAKQTSKVPAVTRYPTVLSTSSSRRDLVFAEKIRKYLRSKKRKDLNQLLSDAAKESGTDGALAGVWAEVTALVDQKIPADRDDATTISLLIEKACLYLQRLFVEHMDVQVERNLERAQRGGVPGTRGLVEAFLKIGADDPFAEDGTVDGLPVWELTYHCLRAGDLAAARGALELLANFPQAAVLVACLNHLTKEEKLDVELKKKLKAEWRHNMNSVKDKYKRALYAALLGLDSNLSDSLENWLWFKLFVLKIDPHMSPILYSEVQKNVSIDYVVVDTTQMTKCSCNIARLLVSYTKEFELDDVARALDYWSLLKGLKTPSGSDVFEMAVSRAVYLTGQADAIIGTLGPNGKRSPGLIDEYIEDASDIICRVAHDTELGGDATQAVRLYMLANTPLKAVELLCSELSDAIRVNRTRMSELRQLAEDFVTGNVVHHHLFMLACYLPCNYSVDIINS